MTTVVKEPAAPPTEAPRRPTRLPWVIVAVVAVIAIAVGAMVAFRDNSDGANAAGTRQLASIQQACAQWSGNSTGSSTPPPGWCDDMVGWMTNQVRSGHMMGSMMWSNPDQMRATCEQWMTSGSATNGSTRGATGWCRQMVAWMTDHMGNWDRWDQGWMMRAAPMMGR